MNLILMKLDYGDRKRTHAKIYFLFNNTHSKRNAISKATITTSMKCFV